MLTQEVLIDWREVMATVNSLSRAFALVYHAFQRWRLQWTVIGRYHKYLILSLASEACHHCAPDLALRTLVGKVCR